MNRKMNFILTLIAICCMSGYTVFYSCCSEDEEITQGEEDTSEVQRPDNVEYFTVDITPQKKVVSYKYYQYLNVKYLLTVQEYSKVVIKWNCKDQSVKGVLVSKLKSTPVDGKLQTSELTKTYEASGIKVIEKWMDLPELKLYIWSYNSEYLFSKNYYYVQEYIPEFTEYTVWSNSPSL